MKNLLMIFALLTSFSSFAFDGVKEVTLNDGRVILAAQNGLTLYTFDVDDPGVSNCHGGCLRAWPALIVDASTPVSAPFGLTTRPDGSLQIMLDNQPLYFFVGDSAEGDINGDGLQGVWHIIEL